MDFEKDFIELVKHVFTLDWFIWALPLSLVLSLLVQRFLPGLALALLAVILHHAAKVAVPLLMAGAPPEAAVAEIAKAAPTLEPISLAAEFVAYAFLIVVFSKTRQDMLRPSVG